MREWVFCGVEHDAASARCCWYGAAQRPSPASRSAAAQEHKAKGAWSPPLRPRALAVGQLLEEASLCQCNCACSHRRCKRCVLLVLGQSTISLENALLNELRLINLAVTTRLASFHHQRQSPCPVLDHAGGFWCLPFSPPRALPPGRAPARGFHLVGFWAVPVLGGSHSPCWLFVFCVSQPSFALCAVWSSV